MIMNLVPNFPHAMFPSKKIEITLKSFILSITTLFFLVSFAYAQKPLTNSRQSSYYTYIYKLTPEEVLSYYKNPKKRLDENILQNPIDSFKTDKSVYWENNLPVGNYLKVYADKNTLNYELLENHNAFFKLLTNNYDIRFVFTDKEKGIIPEKVMVNNKFLAFDTKAGCWHLRYSKKYTIIIADYKGIRNIFSIGQNKYYGTYYHQNIFQTTWNRLKYFYKRKFRSNYANEYNRRYTGFIVFNKPQFKPYDTVKFKAFILKVSTKHPIKVPQLLVRLKNGYDDNGKVIGKVNSYRDGAFEYSFVLSDSLKMQLDDNYIISLEAPSSIKYDLDKYDGDEEDDKFLAKRKVYLTGKFKYEDYELRAIHFNMRADKKEHNPGNPLAIYLKATDENELPVPDGRVRIVLLSSQVNQYKNNKVFVPDTLWTHQMPLEPVGETKLIIPDSIFPKVDLNYRIEADFLNSSNERQTSTVYESFIADKFIVNTKLTRDSLLATFQELGKDKKVQASIYEFSGKDAQDTMPKKKVTLPYKIKINPNASSYEIKTDSAFSEIDLQKSESGLLLTGYRTPDSVFVNIKNERKLHFWYNVFAGNRLIDEGQADSLFYKRAYNKAASITFLLNYIWAGESKTEKTQLNFAEKALTINVKQPLSVYPGQQAETAVVVTDVNGKPVPNTDITAWSLTRKFEYYNVPFVPYLGKGYRQRKSLPQINLLNIEKDGTIKLNWEKFGHEMGLDSITYYKFTHPETVYKIEESVHDSITQIAPFIVNKGEIVPVHILYIDSRPVYFSQAEQLQRYSFKVNPGKHFLRFRTVSQEIVLDSVLVAPSKKLILSINTDTSVNKLLKLRSLPDTLSNYEASLINKYMINIVDNFGFKQAVIINNDQFILLNPFSNNNKAGNTILTGPLSDNFAILKVRDEASRSFYTELGYSFLFEPGLLKQKSIATKYPFKTRLWGLPLADNFRQSVLTQTEADTLWQQFLDLRSNTQSLFTNKPILDRQSGLFQISYLPNYVQKQPFIKNIIIYKYDDPDYIRVYPGNTTNFGKLNPGKYRLFFLLKGDNYDIVDSIKIHPFGINYYKLNIKARHLKDNVSIKINETINKRIGEWNGNDSDIENDALKLKEAFNDKYFDNSTFEGLMSGQVLGQDDKLPITGCTVKLKGTSYGAITDVNGHFKIKVPESGKLIVSFIGYQSKEITVQSGQTVKIYLIPSSNSLNEVVIIGYLSVMKRDLTGAVSILEGKIGGINTSQFQPGVSDSIKLRGINLIGTSKPLIIVDGVPVENIDGIDITTVGDINILKDAAATALYGSRAANGVIIVNTKKKTNTNQSQNSTLGNNELSIRKNFSDYAYWQPKLTTDENGRASFTTTFPDDITNWRTFVIAINNHKQSGYVEHQIKAFKPLSATLVAPQFAVQGDTLSVIGKIMNYNNDAPKVTRGFSYNSKLLKQDDFEVKNSKIDTFKVVANNTDSLQFEYTINRDNGYFDGERHKIAVFEQGTKESKGVFAALNNDTTLNLEFDPKLGPVTLRAEASILPIFAEEAKHLRDYKYLCNEQLASKLKGLLIEKRIDQFLNKPFNYEKNIKEVIKKIQQNRLSQGTWGWWKDTDEELWISLHAIEAFLDAQKEGYEIDIEQQKLTDYLVYQLQNLHGIDKITCLEILLKLKANVDFAKYSTIIENELSKNKNVSKYDRFRFMLLQEEFGSPIKLDSLLLNEKHTMFGNIYWGTDSYHFFDNSTQLGVLAYKILKIEGKHTEELEKIKGYFFEQRRTGEWRNTYESSLILETLLPDLLKDTLQFNAPLLVLKGNKTDTIIKFPFSTILKDSSINIKKSGRLPIYVTGYQQFWNNAPKKESKSFIVDTWFEKNGGKINQLKGGEPILLKTEVTATGDADYVMLEIPIPAGCSYESKAQSWENNEVHREYFKEKVNIFCRKLKQGKYTFSVKLLPRYNGKYTQNPAKAEMMYFPIFYGREGMRKVVIGD